MYQCPHCPAEPPYAGASGLWYHMKRHHGAVTRPYNKTKNRADGTYGPRPIKAKTSVTKKQAKLSKLKKRESTQPQIVHEKTTQCCVTGPI